MDLTLPFVTYILILPIAVYFVRSYREAKAVRTVILLTLGAMCSVVLFVLLLISFAVLGASSIVLLGCDVFPLCIAAAFFY